MAKGATIHGRWGNGAPRQSVTRTGFVENTVTEPKAKPAPPEKAPLLLLGSEPWYETPSRVVMGEDLRRRSVTGGATIAGDVPEARAHDAAPRTKIPTLPPFK